LREHTLPVTRDNRRKSRMVYNLCKGGNHGQRSASQQFGRLPFGDGSHRNFPLTNKDGSRENGVFAAEIHQLRIRAIKNCCRLKSIGGKGRPWTEDADLAYAGRQARRRIKEKKNLGSRGVFCNQCAIENAAN